MVLPLPSSEQWAARCLADGEFQQASRGWSGGLQLHIGTQNLALHMHDGQRSVDEANPEKVIQYRGDETVWQDVLSAVPTRFHNDLMANVSVAGGISWQGDRTLHAQYYPAIMRAVELLRPDPQAYGLRPGDVSEQGQVDAPVGRYVHLNLGGCDHRIYYEEAGQGIPLLLQHTAGCHGSQWRHLFEMPEITNRFRLIAYDLPCHGKSLPPVEQDWWAQPYRLQGEFLRSVPRVLSQVLKLDRPVFMGCSVGGLLALDLAQRHAEEFRAVVSVEGALKVEGDIKHYNELWHPAISNEYKARLMDGLMSPTSPKAYRKETSYVYASGWPPVFLGDLHYYMSEYDLRETAAQIDTNQVGVHILSGEYDYSGRSEFGQEAHEAIPGSTWTEMQGVGHFPMSENPQAFANYLMPILDSLA